MDQIICRKLQKSDYPAVEAILKDAFFLEDAASVSPRIMRMALSHYFYQYLRLHDYSLVAEYRGAPAGIILGRFLAKRNRKTKLPFLPDADGLARRIRYRLLEWLLLLTGARRMIRVNWGICRCNRLLVKGKRKHFDAELLLLLVRADMRRRGIASELSGRFFDAVRTAGSADGKSFGKRKVFLFSDNYCDTAFYLKNGFTLEGQRSLRVPLDPPFEGEFFLFSREL
ncbi:MAG: hypothetical protein LBB82_10920 [Treponema sp.]|jgi:predicted N-acetyltransferase YhbS|nr:hypothetical protein [Treponema sp.]